MDVEDVLVDGKRASKKFVKYCNKFGMDIL